MTSLRSSTDEPWWKHFYDVPYKLGGRTLEGADCYGLVRLVMAEGWGVELDPFALAYAVSNDPSIERAIKDQMRRGPWRPVKGEPAIGDVVLAHIDGWHMGVVVERGIILTAEEGSGVVAYVAKGEWMRVGHFYRHEEMPESE